MQLNPTQLSKLIICQTQHHPPCNGIFFSLSKGHVTNNIGIKRDHIQSSKNFPILKKKCHLFNHELVCGGIPSPCYKPLVVLWEFRHAIIKRNRGRYPPIQGIPQDTIERAMLGGVQMGRTHVSTLPREVFFFFCFLGSRKFERGSGAVKHNIGNPTNFLSSLLLLLTWPWGWNTR